MTFPEYDLVVIGSGPAACAAAIVCRRSGMSVLMITNLFNTAEVDLSRPSETLHPGIASLLNYLGTSEVIEKSSIGKYSGIVANKSLQLLTTNSDYCEYGHHINKDIFNVEMLKVVTETGVSMLYGEIVNGFIELEGGIVGVKTVSGKKIYSKYTIDGSGWRAVSKRILKIKEAFYSPPLLCWTGRIKQNEYPASLKGLSNSPVFNNHESGWTWLAKDATGDLTFTCLSVKGKTNDVKFAGLNLHLNEEGTQKFNMRWKMLDKLAIPGLLICGDAAGIIDPSSGQGILNALYSGIKSGEAAVLCLKDNNNESVHLTGYSRWFKNQFLHKVDLLKNYLT